MANKGPEPTMEQTMDLWDPTWSPRPPDPPKLRNHTAPMNTPTRQRAKAKCNMHIFHGIGALFVVHQTALMTHSHRISSAPGSNQASADSAAL
jgi:hypothetical protein